MTLHPRAAFLGLLLLAVLAFTPTWWPLLQDTLAMIWGAALAVIPA